MLRALVLALALAGCSQAPFDGQTLEAHGDGELIVALHRGGTGPLVSGRAETFELELSAAFAGGDITWTASDGLLVPSGPMVSWSVPSTHTATLTASVVGLDGATDEVSWSFGVRVPTAYVTAMQGQLDGSGDVTGSGCVLRFDSAGEPHVLYQNETHGQIWHATWNGAAWTADLVDGPGFDVGSTISRYIDMEIDSSDDVHVAYAHSNPPYAVWWATDSGGSWTREQVSDSTHFSYTYIGLDLDPAHAERPTVGWSRDTTYDQLVVGYRTGTDTWTQARYPENDYSQQFTGGMAFAADGTLHLAKGAIARYHLTWSETGGFSATDYLMYGTNYRYWSRVVLDDADRPIILHEDGIEHDTGSGFFHSEIENFVLTSADVTWGNGKPYFALRHGQNLELVTTDADGYFDYTIIDTMDDYHPSIALDADGDAHICYRKDGTVHYY